MPKAVDAKHKRSEFVDATWRVIRREGLPAATLRRVASEARCTTGSLTHYFSSREALLAEALQAANHTARARMAAIAQRAPNDAKRLEAIVLEALPLDQERLDEWATRVAFWGEVSNSETLKAENARRFSEWTVFLDRHLAPVVRAASARVVEIVHLNALIDGLGLRLVLHQGSGEKDAATRRLVVTVVKDYLQALERRYG